MKKLSPKQRARHLRILLLKEGRKNSRILAPTRLYGGVRLVVLPVNFSLRNNFEESMGAINKIRKIVLNANERVFIDFQKIEYIGISCAMALAAEMYRCKHLRPGRGATVLNGNYPSNEGVYRRLYMINFFRIFQIGEPYGFRDLRDESGNYNLIMRAFGRVESDKISDFRNACLTAFGSLSGKARRRMQGAITEAVLNSFNHAFDGKADYVTLGRRAWLTGYVNLERQEMSIMIYDQGVGIPRTLPSNLREALLTLIPTLDFNSDSQKILAATQIGRTATLEPGRGKGFSTMKAFVDACEDAELQVFSNCGRYTYSGGADSALDDFGESIGGTLVILRARHTQEEFNLMEHKYG